MTEPMARARGAAADRLAQASPDGPDELGRELAQGPRAVEATLAALEPLGARLTTLVHAARRVVLVGTGASLAAAQAAAPAWRRVTPGSPVIVRQATEAALGDLDGRGFNSGDLVLAISQSGRSPETRAAAGRARTAGAALVAVTAHPSAPLTDGADLVVPIASGEERGASTKSELATLAALLAVGGALDADAASRSTVRRRLDEVVAAWAEIAAPGRALGAARHVWLLGFGAALGIAGGGALLWHEKVIRPATAATPSEFRHGLVEAATPDDALVLIVLGSQEASVVGYLDRLRSEAEALGVTCVEVAAGRPGDTGEALPALASLVRVQQLARAAALSLGTYRDGFAILRTVVTAADDLFS